MIVNPDQYLEAFQEAGANHIIVHYEACTHLHRTLDKIRQLGCKTGVALNPHTPVLLLEDIITITDIVLIMSVNPGFGGQSFIEQSYHKIEKLRTLIQKENAQTIIEVDGGVNDENAAALVNAGADALVAGSSIFKARHPEQAISRLKHPQ